MSSIQAAAIDIAGNALPVYDTPLGITNPPIDELLERASSKYALVIYAAKRARQINDYYNQLGDGILEYVGGLVEPGIAGFDGDVAGFSGGVPRVDAQVGHDLVELAGIHFHEAEAGARLPGQFDFLADQAAQHAGHARDGGVEIQHLEDDGLLAREDL